MMIRVDDRLREAAPDIALGVVTAAVRVTEHDLALWAEIDRAAEQIRTEVRPGLISELPPVRALREAYRRLGVDPNRYRGSAEALLRRVAGGKELYRVNTVVDVNNFVSLAARRPVGSYDRDRVAGPVAFRPGEPGESYRGIGKTELPLAGLPLLADDRGPFGSPTSDSERTMIRPDTVQLVVVVIAFDGPAGLSGQCRLLTELLEAHAGATGLTAEVVVPEGM